YCRFAERELALPTNVPDSGPQGQNLEDWLQRLREQNRELAREQGFEALRAEAERQVRAGVYAPSPGAAPQPEAAGPAPPGAAPAQAGVWPGDLLPRRGTPLYWQGTADAVQPRLLLSATRGQEIRRALAASALLAVLLILAWVLAQLPGVRAWVRLFWPEL